MNDCYQHTQWSDIVIGIAIGVFVPLILAMIAVWLIGKWDNRKKDKDDGSDCGDADQREGSTTSEPG